MQVAFNSKDQHAHTHTHTFTFTQVAFNPKDTNTFASASLDRSIKVCCAHSRV